MKLVDTERVQKVLAGAGYSNIPCKRFWFKLLFKKTAYSSHEKQNRIQDKRKWAYSDVPDVTYLNTAVITEQVLV